MGLTKSSKVLVIGDDPGFRGLICMLLEEQVGVTPAKADHVGDALRRVPGLKPSLVVLDVMQGPAQGMKLINELTSDLRKQAVPLLALIPWRAEGNGLEINCAAYLHKPLDIESLVVTVDRLLSSEHGKMREDSSAQGQIQSIEENRCALENLASTQVNDFARARHKSCI